MSAIKYKATLDWFVRAICLFDVVAIESALRYWFNIERLTVYVEDTARRRGNVIINDQLDNLRRCLIIYVVLRLFKEIIAGGRCSEELQ